MAIDIGKPLNDLTIGPEEQRFLQGVQANILKGHGREHVALIFLGIREVTAARTFLRGYPVTDAYTQLTETEQFKRMRVPGGLVRLVFLSGAGLARLRRDDRFQTFASFSRGMAADALVLDGGTTDSWQPAFKRSVDVMLLVAYHDAQQLAAVVGKMVADFEETAAFEVVFVQDGRAYKNADGEGIEHFGYVDGRSQPLMLQSAIDKEDRNYYDPTSPLGQFLLPDPLNDTGFGSFFVFRKLEQDVAGFKRAESELADRLGFAGDAREQAGAQVVGRFEDGTPLTRSNAEAGMPVLNDFDYRDDADGSRCPFHAHIRKTHPRGSSDGGLAFDQSVQMARRGITYGSRIQDPETKAFVDRPDDGVGLLFMSYQHSIEAQFQFMQSRWANDASFPQRTQAGGPAPDPPRVVGLDPLIGQRGPAEPPPQTWNRCYGPACHPPGRHETEKALLDGFVRLKGGEYFFAPSPPGLRTL